MFLTPGLFGFLFGSAAGYLAQKAAGERAELPARVATMAVYGSLYVAFVYVHLKRVGKSDRVLHPQLTTAVLGLNAVLAVLVISAIVVNFIHEGAWFIAAIYMSVPGFPIACACIGGDWEGARLMAMAFPIFAIVSPSFVGALSAYSAARIADLSWGNRPCVTALGCSAALPVFCAAPWPFSRVAPPSHHTAPSSRVAPPSHHTAPLLATLRPHTSPIPCLHSAQIPTRLTHGRAPRPTWLAAPRHKTMPSRSGCLSASKTTPLCSRDGSGGKHASCICSTCASPAPDLSVALSAHSPACNPPEACPANGASLHSFAWSAPTSAS